MKNAMTLGRWRTAVRPVMAALVVFGWQPSATAAPLVQPKAPGIESAGYVWNVVQTEELFALRATGNAQRGVAAYRICHGCHKAGGLGTPDGAYPRLAGQHDTYLIKQLIDVRTGSRDNAKMYPFVSSHAITTQDIADLAAYLGTLLSPPDNARGEGKALSRGETFYKKDCVGCHGDHGEGIAAKFFPRVAGQHYPYLKKELTRIRDGLRRNAHPTMDKVVKSYSDDDIAAVADYMSRLPGK
jgi:cytochrome c553